MAEDLFTREWDEVDPSGSLERVIDTLDTHASDSAWIDEAFAKTDARFRKDVTGRHVMFHATNTGDFFYSFDIDSGSARVWDGFRATTCARQSISEDTMRAVSEGADRFFAAKQAARDFKLRELEAMSAEIQAKSFEGDGYSL